MFKFFSNLQVGDIWLFTCHMFVFLGGVIHGLLFLEVRNHHRALART